MDLIKTVELKKSIIADNDEDAKKLREELKEQDIFYVNIMSAPGSGKTSLLVSLISSLSKEFKLGVMEADIDGDIDAYRVKSAGAEAIQLHTDGMCHLDADMSRQGFKEFKTAADIVFLENIGNLVCPAEFDTGAHLKIALLSVTEGDDKPLKYSLMFSTTDIVVITKTDVKEYFDFNTERCKEYIHRINPSAVVIETSAKNGEGIGELAAIIGKKAREYKR